MLEYDESLIVPDPAAQPGRGGDRSLDQAALRDAAAGSCSSSRAVHRRRSPQAVVQAEGGPPPRAALRHARAATSGSSPSSRASRRSGTSSTSGCFCGSTSWRKTCGECGGTRLNPDALAVRIGGETIAQVAARSVDGIHEWLASLTLTAFEREVAQLILDQLEARLELPPRRGAGLSDARPADPHAVRRRGAADLALQRARLPAGGHAVRAGRALDRPAPARHRPPARHCSAGCGTPATR